MQQGGRGSEKSGLPDCTVPGLGPHCDDDSRPATARLSCAARRSRRGRNHPTAHNVTLARRNWGWGGGGLPVGGGVDAILAPMRTPIRYWYERSVGPDHFSWVTLRGHGSNSRYIVWLQFRSQHCYNTFWHREAFEHSIHPGATSGGSASHANTAMPEAAAYRRLIRNRP